MYHRVHIKQQRRSYQSVHCLLPLPPSAFVLFKTTVCYNLNTAIISFCTVITNVAILTPVSSRAWQHALINTVQHSISLYQPEYGCGPRAESPALIKRCREVMWEWGRMTRLWREWGVWLYLAIKKEISLFLENLIYSLAIAYTKFFGSEKKYINKLARFSLGKVI